MSSIFISHSSKNNAEALAIGQWLTDNGWNEYFLDIHPDKGIKPGTRWQEELRKSSNLCEVVILLISPDWIASDWCKTEYLLAKQLGKTIVGVIIKDTPDDEIPDDLRAEWQLCDLTQSGSSVAITIANDLVPATTEVRFSEYGLRFLKRGLDESVVSPDFFEWPPANNPSRSPFPGLKALEEDEAAIFFGRDGEIIQALDTVNQIRNTGFKRSMVILGASGAGKSSFMKAGLWPRLARDRHYYPIPIIRPEGDIINGAHGLSHSLRLAFESVNVIKASNDIAKILKTTNGLTALLKELREKVSVSQSTSGNPVTLILGLDQAEELFNANGLAEANNFVELLNEVFLSDAAKVPPLLIVVSTIRSDSFEQFQTHQKLRDVQFSIFDLSPVQISEYKNIIEGPALKQTQSSENKLTIEPALTDRLLKEADGPDSLPLIAFTLERLYIDYGSSGHLNLAQYEQFGGVRGAIETVIKLSISQCMSISESVETYHQLLKKAFVPWLASVNPDTGEYKRNVANFDDLPKESESIIQQLVEHRLLRKDNKTVEVAHEALLRQWPLLTTWLDEEKDNLIFYEALERAAKEWASNDQSEEMLLHAATRLSSAVKLLINETYRQKATQNAFKYISACKVKQQTELEAREKQLEVIAQEQAKTTKLQSRGKKALMLFGVILATASIFLFKQTTNLNLATSKTLANDALSALKNDDTSSALKLAIASAKVKYTNAENTHQKATLLTVVNNSPDIASFRHASDVNTAHFSPDGTMLLTASADMSARLWALKTGVNLMTFSHENAVKEAIFSGNGQHVLTASADGTAILWEMKSGAKIRTFEHDGAVNSVEFSPNENFILTSTTNNVAVLWDVETGKEIHRFSHDESVESACFNDDGNLVLTASLDGTASLWQTKSGKEIRTFAHLGSVHSARFNKHSTAVLTSSYDQTAILWDINTGQKLQTFQHQHSVNQAVFSHDDEYILTASNDHTAVIWDVKTAKKMSTFEHDEAITAATFSPDDQNVMTASWNGIATLWRASTGKKLNNFKHQKRVLSVAFNMDGGQAVTTSADGVASLWDTKINQPLQHFQHNKKVNMAVFNKKQTQVLTASKDATAKLWHIASKENTKTFTHKNEVYTAVFNENESQVLTASWNKALIWNVESEQNIHTFPHTAKVRYAIYHPNGDMILTASKGSAILWDIKSNKRIKAFQHPPTIHSIAFNKSGSQLLTASKDNTARLWDVASNETIMTFQHDKAVNAAVFSPDEKYILTASTDRNATLWEVETGKKVSNFGHNQAIYDVAFSHNGQYVLTSSLDDTAAIWDVNSGRRIKTLVHGKTVHSGRLGLDNTKVLTATSEKNATLWQVRALGVDTTSQLLENICESKLIGNRVLTKKTLRLPSTYLVRTKREIIFALASD